MISSEKVNQLELINLMSTPPDTTIASQAESPNS